MHRSGSITVLFLLLLIAVIAVGAMAVDLAMIEAARTDMRITADLASRAATVQYIETESISSARARAKEIATINHVAGANLTLDDTYIIPGHSTRQSSGKYVFSSTGTPINSFRVNARLENGSTSGSLNTMFSKVHQRSAVDIVQTATATETYLDIVLVLDRSGSMGWDNSGVSWQYPNGLSDYYNYYAMPLPGSRWESLENAVQVFVNEMDQKEKKEQVAVVTYSSSYYNYSYYFGKYFSVPEVSTDQTFTDNYSLISASVFGRGDNPDTPIIGGTAISSGIDRARTLLAASPRVGYAEKIIILMTDGQWNVGYNPVTAANSAAAEDVTIHTVAFGAGASASVMQQVADATGGVFYNAPSDAALQTAFQEIARSIGISLTE